MIFLTATQAQFTKLACKQSLKMNQDDPGFLTPQQVVLAEEIVEAIDDHYRAREDPQSTTRID